MTAASRNWHRVGLPLLVLRVLGQGLEFGAFVVLARRLGTAEFGRLSVAFLICRYGGLVADWGASIRGVRDVAAERDPDAILGLVHRRGVVTAVLVLAYLLGVVALGQPQLAPLAVTIVARGLNRDWLSLGRQRGLHSGLPLAAQGACILAGSLLVTSASRAPLSIAAGYLVALVLSIRLNPLPAGRRRRGAAVGSWLVVAVLAEQVVASIDTMLLALLRSPEEAGIYAAIYRIPNAWLTLIGLAAVGLLPRTARALAKDPATILRLRRRALRVGAVAGAAVVATIPLTYLLVPAIYGDAYRSGRNPIIILLLATAVTAVAAPLHPLYISLARDRRQAAVSVVAAGVNVAGNLVLIPSLGMTAAAWTTVAAQLILLLAFWRGTSWPGTSRPGTSRGQSSPWMSTAGDAEEVPVRL